MTVRHPRVLAVLALLVAPAAAGGRDSPGFRRRDRRHVRVQAPNAHVHQVTRPRARSGRRPRADRLGGEEGRPVLPARRPPRHAGRDDSSVGVVSETSNEWTELAGKELGRSARTSSGPTARTSRPSARSGATRRSTTAAATGPPRPPNRRDRQLAAPARRLGAGQPLYGGSAAKTVRMVTAAVVRVDFVPVGDNRRPGALDLGAARPPRTITGKASTSALLNYDAAKAFRSCPGARRDSSLRVVRHHGRPGRDLRPADRVVGAGRHDRRLARHLRPARGARLPRRRADGAAGAHPAHVRGRADAAVPARARADRDDRGPGRHGRDVRRAGRARLLRAELHGAGSSVRVPPPLRRHRRVLRGRRSRRGRGAHGDPERGRATPGAAAVFPFLPQVRSASTSTTCRATRASICRGTTNTSTSSSPTR